MTDAFDQLRRDLAAELRHTRPEPRRCSLSTAPASEEQVLELLAEVAAWDAEHSGETRAERTRHLQVIAGEVA